MIVVLFFLAPALLYGIADLTPDIRSGGRKLPAIYIAVMAAAFTLWMCVKQNIDLVSPSEIVASILKAILPIR